MGAYKILIVDLELYMRYSTQKSPECKEGMSLVIFDTIQNRWHTRKSHV
jgi:hypothetical protein